MKIDELKCFRWSFIVINIIIMVSAYRTLAGNKKKLILI